MTSSTKKMRKVSITNKSILAKIETYKLSAKSKKALIVAIANSVSTTPPRKIIAYRMYPNSDKINTYIIYIAKSRNIKGFRIQQDHENVAIYSVYINENQNENGNFMKKLFRNSPDSITKLFGLGGLIVISDVSITRNKGPDGTTLLDSADLIKAARNKGDLERIMNQLLIKSVLTLAQCNNLGCTYALLGKYERRRYNEAQKTLKRALNTTSINELIKKIISHNMYVVDEMSKGL